MVIEFNDNGDMAILWENNTEKLALRSWIDTNVLFVEDQISINMGALTVESDCDDCDLIDLVMREKEA